MASDAVLQLTAICAVASFFWVTNSFERHSLVEHPRLSSLLVLFIAACLSFLASFFSEWLPGANGRFDEDYSSLLKTARASLPRRPRRYFLPALILCIVLRLEIFHRVTFQFQCSAPGIESYLCTILVVYDILSTKRTRIINTDPINPWDGPLDDLKAWLSDSRWVVVASSLVLSHGTFLSVTQARPSTFFCSSLLDGRLRTVSLQLVGLGLDATITILLWRILVWSKTTRSRLRTLAGVLLAAAGAISALWIGARLYRSRSGGNSSFASVGSLYTFDVFVDGCAVAALVVSFTLVACESNPVLPVSTITFVGGLLASWRNTSGLGSWEHESVLEALGSYGLVSIGFVVFLYSSSIRSVLLVRRFFLLLLLISVAIGMSIFACVKTKTLDNHPINQLLFEARIEADRWLRHASVSDSLKVAVDEYRERHGGRDPPPHFDKWFQFARDKKSAVIDHFQQIEDDIRPFWGLKPGEIRERTEELAGLPRIAMLTIDHGTVSHTGVVELADVKVMDDLVAMIESFATHLHFALKLPINLHDAPRVITPWEEVERHTQNGKSKAFQMMAKLDDRATADPLDPMQGRELAPAEPQSQNRPRSGWTFTTPRDLRHMEALACPPASPGRSGLHWNVRDFCSACVSGFSQGQFLAEWAGVGGALDACAQPDLTSLHGFHLASPRVRPLMRLMPVFSRAKISHFGDVLLPLAHPDADEEEADSTVDFQARNDKPYWRGAVDVHPRAYRALRGDQRARLLHLVNNATATDEVTMLLPTRGDKKRLAYEVVSAGEASTTLGFDVRPERYSACLSDDCAILEQELGLPVPRGQWRDHKYVLLLDSETGPAPQTLSVLRSESLPLVATTFRTWYTERLQPWLHFVPIDLRWHALHSTVAYFLGLKGRGALGGRKEVELEGRGEDARWIAGQGHVWAAKSLRREDMEVYLFRLVLEWARVVDDGRDSMGFKPS